MRPALELTSIPPWTITPTVPDADTSGRSWTIIGIGDAEDVITRWQGQLAGPDESGGAVEVHRVDTDERARAVIDATVATAVVGWRLMIAGPARIGLRMRAHALAHGLADDEITIASTDVAERDVFCTHCRTVTAAAVEVEGLVSCAGCGRKLMVHYHVSRRAGAHLGYMVDAEQQAVTPQCN
ncbi:dimethylamine monooxygenase subunit DmmA family protein [Mycolicibacterium goodii]|uniref:Dimethylamine monooxygenase subunit DmmA-like C-terminal domain-containing protein n=1 Tax=Mycolicibacterium goodii TaxID=134601 RepID=A0A0K0X7I5_MYCGD|nr:hypothetical protein AFA91_17355 [Mycolicibacterium goodii]